MSGWRKRTIMDMARKVKLPYDFVTGEPLYVDKLEAFAALVREPFKPDWDAMAVTVEEQQRMAKRPQPLTSEQLTEIYTQWELKKGSSWADLMRSVEAAHGIKENT